MNSHRNVLFLFIFLCCLITNQGLAQKDKPSETSRKIVKILVFCSDAFGICHLINQELFGHRYYTDVSSLPWQLIDVMKTENAPRVATHQVRVLPTFIAINADGKAIRRREGYANREETIKWFRSLSFSQEDLGTNTAHMTREFAENNQKEAAKRSLANAQEGVDLRIARFFLEKRREDAQWLFDQAVPNIWTEEALSLFPDLWSSIDTPFLQRTSEPFTQASLLLIAADAAKRENKKEQAKELWERSVKVILDTCWLDIPKNDRAYAWLLVDLYKRLERWEEADRVLQTMITAFPNDLFFSVARVRLLLSQDGRQAEALALARHLHQTTVPRDHLYRLWTARVLAETYTANTRKQDAIMVLTQTLASVETVSFPDTPTAQTWREWQKKTRKMLSRLQTSEIAP